MLSNWFVYIVECSDCSFYTGVAKDVLRRLKEHNAVKKKAAKYTWSRRPVKLVWLTQVSTRGEALSLEYKIKKLSRKEKLKMLSEDVYVIVCHSEAGHKIFHGSTDLDETKDKVSLLKKMIIAVNEEKDRLNAELSFDQDWCDGVSFDKYFNQMTTKFGKEFTNYTGLEPEGLCILKSNLIDEAKCYCSEAGIGTGHTNNPF